MQYFVGSPIIKVHGCADTILLKYLNFCELSSVATLTVCDYIETVKDTRFPKRSDMRVFGKKYLEEDVYIKIRVELIGAMGIKEILVMSFLFAEFTFVETVFPYREKRLM